MWFITFTFFLIALSLFFLHRKKHFSIFKEVGIPGPEPSLLFGNFLEIVRKSPTTCEKEWVKKYGKIVGFFFGGYPYVMVADPELLKKILITDFQKFINRPLQALRLDVSPYTDQLVNLHDKRWKDVRTIVSPAFTTSKLKQLTVLINDSANTLLHKMTEKAKSGKEFDIHEFFQMYTMEVIGRTAFGFNSNCQTNRNDNLVASAKTILSGKLTDTLIVFVFIFPELANMWFRVFCFVAGLYNKSGDPFKDLINSLKVVIKNRRENVKERRTDLLQSMLDVHMNVSSLNDVKMSSLEADDKLEDKIDSDEKTTGIQRTMTDDEILGNSLLFLVAGYETTSTALAFAAHCLVHHQDVQDKVREEIRSSVKSGVDLDYTTVHGLTYLDQVFNECLRFFPPVNLFTLREAAEDISYGDFKLKKGMTVFSPTSYLQHSEELWDEPEKFNPDRFSADNKSKYNPLAFQPFGIGPRNCVGMRMAKTTAKLALAKILKDHKLVPSENSCAFPTKVRAFIATLNPENGVKLKVMPV